MTEYREDEFKNHPDLIRKRAKTIFWQRVGLFAFSAILIINILLAGANAVASFSSRHAIVDCTSPNGDCFHRGQVRTANLLQHLIESNHIGDLATQEIVRYSAICSSIPDNAGNELKINRCINRMLAEDKKKR